ncbi:hypothetical protein PLEOSDRAFT_1114178 [Pleurotus ostreatus PC15]|uniref:Abscisic acid G-protein coupled receptor-like domain-containing protein n=1 Tax=Pleurotus ostreatus (strain PC15) TaxID=1137138 RepID=A0A067NIM0_PLEO1|nr:hypothetical protein PLEOSDRAFT_1114178 [Pleurotus ostreatus PC15]
MDDSVTGVLAIACFRLFLVWACREFLLRSSLYADLQHLSAQTEGVVENDAEWVALPTFSPRPTSAGRSPPTSPKPSAPRLSLHSRLSRIAFSACFAESMTLVLLLVLQTLDILSSRTRLLNWILSQFLFIFLLLVLIPLVMTIVLSLGATSGKGNTAKRRAITIRFVLNVIPVLLFLVAFSYVPLPDESLSADIRTSTLSRLNVLGTIVLGLLSGFGAISNAWAFLPFSSRSRASIPSEGDIKSADLSLTRIRDDISQLRLQLQGSSVPSGAETSKDRGQGTWYSRFLSKFEGDDRLQELKGLEALEHQMSLDLNALRQRRQTAIFSATLKGRLYNLSGRLFSIYCIIRVISSIVNIISSRSTSHQTSYPDLITQFLAYLLTHISSEVNLADVARMSRQISLVLVGVIILSSIRLVLRGVTRALHVSNRSLGASLMLLVLAQLMGIYMLSTIVQLRSTFPPPPTDSKTSEEAQNLFSLIPKYEVFGSLFDWSFVVAAGATLVVRWGAEKMGEMS